MVKKRGEGLLKTSSLDIEQHPNDGQNIVRSICPPDTKHIRIDFECKYLLNALYHEEHNFFGNGVCSYYRILWNEISEISKLHGWFLTVFFILLHLVIIMPIKLLLNPPCIPRRWMRELKLEIILPPFPGYTEKQRWCFARKLWFNHKAEHAFDEKDGVKLWEGFCYSEKEYLQIRERVWSRMSYFVERTSSLKAALYHGLKETDLRVVEDSGLWVSYMALGYRCLRLMTIGEAKSIPGSGFLIRYNWWHFHIFNGWARVHAKVEGEGDSEEKGVMVVMHLYVSPLLYLPFKFVVNTIYVLYCSQLEEVLDLFC